MMKTKTLVPSVAMLITLSVNLVKSQDFENFPVTGVYISDNIRLYKTGLTDVYPNMIAVNTSAGIVVFDALQYPEVTKRVRTMIEKDFDEKVIYLVNTHGPIDHTGGNIIFKDVPIIGSEKIIAVSDNLAAIGKNPQSLQWFEAEMIDKPDNMRSSYPGNPMEIDESIESIKAMIHEMTQDTFHLVLPDTLIREKFTLLAGKTTIFMESNTPSYSFSDIVIFLPEEKALIVGDIFNKNRLPWLRSVTDIEKWERLFEPYIKENTKVKYFLGTHGYPLTVGEIREQFRYLQKLNEEVKRCRTEGKTIDETKNILALDKFPYLSRYNPYFFGTALHVHNLNIEAIWKKLK